MVKFSTSQQYNTLELYDLMFSTALKEKITRTLGVNCKGEVLSDDIFNELKHRIASACYNAKKYSDLKGRDYYLKKADKADKVANDFKSLMPSNRRKKFAGLPKSIDTLIGLLDEYPLFQHYVFEKVPSYSTDGFKQVLFALKQGLQEIVTEKPNSFFEPFCMGNMFFADKPRHNSSQKIKTKKSPVVMLQFELAIVFRKWHCIVVSEKCPERLAPPYIMLFDAEPLQASPKGAEGHIEIIAKISKEIFGITGDDKELKRSVIDNLSKLRQEKAKLKNGKTVPRIGLIPWNFSDA